MDGMPHGSTPGDSTASLAVKLADDVECQRRENELRVRQDVLRADQTTIRGQLDRLNSRYKTILCGRYVYSDPSLQKGWKTIARELRKTEITAQRWEKFALVVLGSMENILKVFLMAFPEWLACIFMVVGLVVTALAAVRLGYGLVVAKTVYKWIVNAEEKFGAGAGAEKKAHVIAVLRGYTPDWLDWAINERTLDWIVQLVFDFTKKKLEDYMAKKSVETTTVARFGKAGEDKRND